MKVFRLLYHVLPRTLVAHARSVGHEASPAHAFSLRYGDVGFRLHLVADRSLFHHIYSEWAGGGEVYEIVMLECLTRLLRQLERPNFIDIGAFMGHYACYVTALLGDREETYAIESNPRYYAAILRSIQLNGFSKLRPFNVVLSDRVEVAGIDEQTVLFFEPGGVTAQSLTLDELCRREGIRPKIVKIDVHGSEGKVLWGMQDVMSQCIEYILLELHPPHLLEQYSGAIGTSDILTLLERLGFHVFFVGAHRGPGSEKARRALDTGFVYRRLDAATRDLLLFDRWHDVFLLCSKTREVEAVLGRRVE